MGSVTSNETAARAVANRIADALLDSAIAAGDRVGWLGPTIEVIHGEARGVQRTGDATLYDGSAGIALGCSIAAETLGRTELADLAVRAARHALSGSERVSPAGLYDGAAGIAIAAIAVGRRADESGLVDAGRTLLRAARERIPERSDLINGAAGTALAMLRAAELTGEDEWIAAAVELGRIVAARALRRPWGFAWRDDEEHPPLCGLAHGASGPAWVLGEIASAADLGDDRELQDTIAGALRFERSWFDAKRNDWPDLRCHGEAAGADPPFPAVWCHGSAGIGLARLALLGLRPHPSLAAEAAAALQSACASAADDLAAGGPAQGLTICHGLGGALELLVEAHRVLGEPEHLATARWLFDRALVRLGDDVTTWRGGVRGLPGPGLMNGLTGAMCVALELEDPAGTRCVGLARV
jgi:lantibiotic biosynthesis protein